MTSIFLPYVTSTLELDEHLRRLGEGASAAYDGNVHTLQHGEVCSAPQRDAAFYVSAVDVDGVSETCLELMEEYGTVAPLRSYEFVAGLPGMQVQLAQAGESEPDGQMQPPHQQPPLPANPFGDGDDGEGDDGDAGGIQDGDFFADRWGGGGGGTPVDVFAVSRKKDGNFFDLCVYFAKESESDAAAAVAGVISYNNLSHGNVRHSGDVGALLHTVHNLRELPEDQIAVVTCIGYNHRPLRCFAEHVPTVCIVDHANKTLIVVPCPLEPALIGEKANVATVAVIRRQGSTLQVVVPEQPGIGEGVNSGEINDICSALVQETARNVEFGSREGVSASRTTDGDDKPPSLSRQASLQDASKAAVYLLCAVQDGVQEQHVSLPDATHAEGCLLMAFGRRPHPYPPLDIPPMATNLALPFCEWTAGHVLALAGQQSLLPQTWPAIAAARHAIVHVTPEGWVSGLRGASFSHHLNALFVIHPKVDGKGGAPLEMSREAREAWLNALPTNFMAFAGRRSIVVVRVGEARYLWYTGPRWAGLVDSIPAFGDEVDGIVERFPAWASARAQALRPGLEDASSQAEEEATAWYSASEPLEWRLRFRALLDAIVDSLRQLGEVRSAPTAGLADHQAKQGRLAALKSEHDELLAKVGDLACEMRVLLPTAMKDARGELLDMLRQASTTLMQEVDNQRAALGPISLEAITCDATLKNQLAALSARKKELQDAFDPVANALSLMFSNKGSSTRGCGICRALFGKDTALLVRIWHMPLVVKMCGSVSRHFGVGPRSFKSDLSPPVLRHSLRAMQRRQAIQQNVGKAEAMTRADIAAYMAQQSRHGVLLVDMSSADISRAIEAVSAPPINQQQAALPAVAPRPLLQCGDGGLIDDTTAEVLIETVPTSKAAPAQQHPLADSPLAVAQGRDDQLARESALLIPIGAAADMRQPHLCNWRTETNTEQFATYRILLRGLFAGVRGAAFQPQSNDLGRFLVHALLALIESLAAAGHGAAKPNIVRGIYCHLLALMASGAKAPLSNLYAIVYPTPSEFPMPESAGDWTCLLGFGATGWDLEAIDNNIRRVLVRSLRRAVDPMTKPLRDNLSRMRAEQAKNHLQRRNAELEWFALMANVVSRANMAGAAAGGATGGSSPSSIKPLLTRAQAERLLALAPPQGQGSRSDITVTPYKILLRYAEGGSFDEGMLRKALTRQVVSRSAVFKQAKLKAHEEANKLNWRADPTLQADSMEAFTDIGDKTWTWLERQLCKGEEWIAQQVGAEMDLVQARMQNKRMRKAAGKDARARTQALMGDAELRRQPWSVGKAPAIDKERLQDRAHFVLTGEDFLSQDLVANPALAAAGAGPVPVDAAGRLIKDLEDNGAREELVRCARVLCVEAAAAEHATVERQLQALSKSAPPLQPFCALAQMVGIADVQEFVADSLKTLMVEWRDSMGAEDAILRRLQSGSAAACGGVSVSEGGLAPAVPDAEAVCVSPSTGLVQRVAAIREALGIGEGEGSLPASLAQANALMGFEAEGSLPEQADRLAAALGL